MTERIRAADTRAILNASGSPGAGSRIARGFTANVAGTGITLLIQLVSVPVFLAAWGVPVYGQWLVLSAIPTYVALSDLSFSSVAGNSMVMLEAEGRRAEAMALGRRLWSIVTILTGGVVLAAIAIALVFGGAFGGGAAIPTSEVQLVLAALFLQVAVGNQYGVLDAWYRAGGRYPLGAAVRQLGRVIEFGALIGVVLLGARPGAAAVAFLAGSVLAFGVSWLILRRAVAWSSFRPDGFHRQTFRDLLPPGLAYMAFPIGNALSVEGFTIAIGSTLGPAAVVVFSATRTATRVPLRLVGAISSSIWTELSRSVGGGHLDEARTILRRATQLSLVVSLSLVLPLALVGPPLIRSWTHSAVDPPLALLYVLLLVIVGNSIWYTLSTALVATNRHKRLAIVYLSGSTVALLAAIPLSSAFGLVGAATALLAIDAGMVVYVLPAALDVVQDLPNPFMRALLDLPATVRSIRSHAEPSA